MLLIGSRPGETAAPELWTAQATMDADALQVLEALTDPALIALWAPVSFELRDPGAPVLRAGSCESVSGSIAGLRVGFEVHVTRADRARLELTAEGPVSLDVAYRFRERGAGVMVDVTVAVRRRNGLTAQVLRAAVGALLSAGALDSALARLQSAVRERSAPALVAA
jgi:hypothetical protein